MSRATEAHIHRSSLSAQIKDRIAAAREHLVTGELLRRGWIARRTPSGTADFDMIAIKHDRTIKVRVKTKTADSKIFRWNRRKDNGKAFRTPPGGRFGADDFCVLVDLAGATPAYFICPTVSVEHKIQEHRANSPMLTIDRSRNDAWLFQFKDNWTALQGSKS